MRWQTGLWCGAADLSVDAARQNTIQVQSARYPQLSASITAADAYRETTTQDGKDVTLDTRIAAGGLNNPIVLRRESNGLFLSQLVTDFGRTSNLVESAKLSETAQQHLANATRAQVLLEISDAYFAALEAQSVLQVAAKTVDARSVLLDRISAMAKNKLKSELDVSFAQVNLGEARLLLLRAENAVDAAFARLSTSLGYRDARRFTLADESTAPPLGRYRYAAGTGHGGASGACEPARRPGGRQEIRGCAKALRYPTINLYAAAGVTPYGDDRLSRNYGAIGVNLNVPCSMAGRFRRCSSKRN